MRWPQTRSLTISSTGQEIPIVGLGTWKSGQNEVTQAVMDAIDVGYRHIDCALLYGNQAEVGKAISTKIKEGVVQRGDLFITDKLWNTYHSENKVVPTLKKTLKDLGMDYVDLYLIHWPMGFQEGGEHVPLNEQGQVLYSDVDFVDTWRGMEECVRLGLANNIGVSNFNHFQLERILDNSKIKPAVNQIECHPYLNQKKLIDFCQSKDILVVAYSPLGSADRPWATPEDPKLVEDPRIKEIAGKYSKTPAQVILRYQIQRGLVVIPKTVRKDRLIENLDIFNFKLSLEDMSMLDSFDRNWRVCHTTRNKHHKYYPFLAEY